MQSKTDFKVYVRKQIPSSVPGMEDWCQEHCEGLYTYHYVSWLHDRWLFTHESDAVNFSLTWSDVVDSDP